VKEELDKSVIQYGLEPAKEMIKEFVGALDKKEWKISEIIQKFIESEVMPDDRNESGTISFNCETTDYGTIFISFDEEESKKRYTCDYQLMIDKKGKLYSPTIKGNRLTATSENLYGFDLFIFKLYAMGCIIEVDGENVDTGWSTYDF